jgi:hypothetical protein
VVASQVSLHLVRNGPVRLDQVEQVLEGRDIPRCRAGPEHRLVKPIVGTIERLLFSPPDLKKKVWSGLSHPTTISINASFPSNVYRDMVPLARRGRGLLQQAPPGLLQEPPEEFLHPARGFQLERVLARVGVRAREFQPPDVGELPVPAHRPGITAPHEAGLTGAVIEVVVHALVLVPPKVEATVTAAFSVSWFFLIHSPPLAVRS